METVTFYTYPPLTMADGSENKNYDFEVQEFTVSKKWAYHWIEAEFENLEEFSQSYTWDDTLAMYYDANEEGVIVSEKTVSRGFGW